MLRLLIIGFWGDCKGLYTKLRNKDLYDEEIIEANA